MGRCQGSRSFTNLGHEIGGSHGVLHSRRGGPRSRVSPPALRRARRRHRGLYRRNGFPCIRLAGRPTLCGDGRTVVDSDAPLHGAGPGRRGGRAAAARLLAGLPARAPLGLLDAGFRRLGARPGERLRRRRRAHRSGDGRPPRLDPSVPFMVAARRGVRCGAARAAARVRGAAPARTDLQPLPAAR